MANSLRLRKFLCYPETRPINYALNAEVGEVNALPELVVDKHSSDVAKRIKDKRLKLHEASLEDMYQDLGVINSNIEVMLENCCKHFSEKVTNIDKITESLLDIDATDKNLLKYTYEELNKLQADIQNHTECKLKYIQYLDNQFHEIENSRVSQIQTVLSNYKTSFQEIAYLTTPEVYRLMESEVQIINQTLLNNKQSYTDIYTQLLLVNIEQDRKHHLNWKSIMTLWRNKNVQEILERFRRYMLTTASTKPKEVQILLDEINTKFSNVLNEYKEHLQFLRSFLPPKCTKAFVAEWFGKINEVTEKLKKEKREFLINMKAEYEKCNLLCLEKMQEEEEALVETYACTEEKASELSTRYMLPLIQLQQKNFECSLSTWDDDITKEVMCTSKKVDKVYAYISAIADIWLNHTQELDVQEQKLNQMLTDNRERHNIDTLKQSFSQADPNDDCICTDPAESGSTSTESSRKSSSKMVISPSQQPLKLPAQTEKPGSHLDLLAPKTLSPDAILVTKQSTQYCYEATSMESVSFIDEQDLVTKQVHIPGEYISDLKTNICMNMLNHLDLWLVDAVKKAKQALEVKIEELDSELSLRIHLHQPRAKRIEEDIHDVRKDELVNHSKRITEHCQGVEDAFTDMKMKLNQIKESQDALMADFESQIEAMEPAFLNVSKSEKLVSLRNNLTSKINKLMANIRKILREYRSDFDQDLQKVKDANATLMKSFRPFSERGNFCPEEIQQYQKVIDKFGTKVDQFEGKILFEMEGMESARYDQANKITLQFEERFKNHVFDLQFIELIARWFTNTQVKIKSDVAKCNNQGKSICNILDKLEKKIDYLTEPHPDKLKCSPSELTADLANALSLFCSRAINLIGPRSNKESSAFKSGFLNVPSEVPTTSKPGKSWTDDASVFVAKNILRSNKLVSGSEGSMNAREKSDGTATDAVGSATNFPADPKMKLTTKKSLTQLRKPQTLYTGQDMDSKAVFEQMYRLGKIKKILLSHKIRQKLFSGELEVKESEEGELELVYDFLGTIRQYLQVTFDNVLIIADDYYRVKGVRPVTRPQVIQDNVDSCAVLMKKKLKSYYTQATEFTTRCQTEFSKQIQQLERIASRIPGIVMNEQLKDHTNSIELMLKDRRKVLEAKLEEFQAKQASNREQLQPDLGHPQMKEKLNKLSESEHEQHEALMTFMQSHFTELKAEVIKASGPFLKELCTTSESLLQLYDTLFKDPSQRREKMRINPADVYALVKNVPIHERATWPGLPLKDFYTQLSLESPFSKAVSISVTTSRCMFPHHATVKARNQTFQMYKEFFKNTLQNTEREEKDALEREMKRLANWQASVKNIQNLYN
ncbi:Hypothetical predicted protein [Octopus vulgaris]|uniref:Coiled-coil domain-containing protein 180-like n=1 Tax=Octopus vulgaris TaxID=6645 RepID=A0AA36BR69_OCTVU|nr:Hypothetical predicted protein [Octopus vulgaris]